MEITAAARRRFAYLSDGDDARDLALDWDADLDAQYDDYVSRCDEAGVVPAPR